MPLMVVHLLTISGIFSFSYENIAFAHIAKNTNFPLAPWGEGVT